MARRLRVPAGKHREFFDIGLQQRIADVEVFAYQQVEEAGDVGRPNSSGSDGCATSPSTSSTVLSNSIAMLMARLSATNVLPSPCSALVTSTRLPLRIRVRDWP